MNFVQTPAILAALEQVDETRMLQAMIITVVVLLGLRLMLSDISNPAVKRACNALTVAVFPLCCAVLVGLIRTMLGSV